jgi:eukaryotic-like serine/threonine-protein kinase
MKKLLSVLLVGVSASLVPLHANAQVHRWTNKEGAIITAEFVSATDEAVTISMKGKTYVVRLADLTPQSQALAKKLNHQKLNPEPPEPTTLMLWEFITGDRVIGSPSIGVDGTVYVGSTDRKVYALNGKTGAKKWEFETGSKYGTAIVSTGTVYVRSRGKKVYALNGKTGAKKWEFETGGIVTSSPTIGVDGTVYVAHQSTSGRAPYKRKIYALKPPKAIEGSPFAKTGINQWEFILGGRDGSSPVIGVDGTVYVGSFDRKVYALNGKTGSKKWEFKTGREVYHSPVIGADGTVYVGSADKKVYALNGKTGAKKWEFITGDRVIGSPAIGPDGTVYVGSEDKKVYALAP